MVAFLAVHVALIRRSPTRAIYALLSSFMVSWAVGLAVAIVGSSFLISGSEPTYLIAIGVLLVLYSLLFASYFFGVFTVADSSLRLDIFRTIALSGKQGVSAVELRRRYNTKKVIGQRLARLVAAGEIGLKNGLYYQPKGRSLVVFRE